MKERAQGRVRMKDRLLFRVFLNYALIMILFALITGIVFISLYRKLDIENNRSRLLQQAQGIAKQIQEYQRNGDISNGLTYISAISTIQSLEIWVVANPGADKPLNPHLTSVDLSGVELSDGQLEVISEAFRGKDTDRIYYSEIHAYTVLSVGTPIMNSRGEACGAVILNTEMASIDRGVNNILRVIVMSVLIALGLSFIVAIWFARQLTIPFSRMRSMALKLADGNYEVSTGIDRKDEVGDLARTLDFLTDKLKENEIERENLEHMRMDFFANVSHELRTPITVVRAYTESLVDKIVTDPEQVEQYYERMLSECNGMERLVGDLLTLSKMQNPDFVIEKEPVDLIQVFRDLIRAATKIAEEKSVTVKFECNCDICLMNGDYGRLRQMFLVILDNAIKFSNEGGEVVVRITKEDKLSISIRDNGIGIAPEELPYVFDKFYKSKLRQNAKGSGLGLAIAKQIALKHGGSIQINSEPAKGTEFIFTFDYLDEADFT